MSIEKKKKIENGLFACQVKKFTQDLVIRLVCVDTMYDGEGELPFGKVFCETFIRRILNNCQRLSLFS